jgi:hypothetical protein
VFGLILVTAILTGIAGSILRAAFSFLPFFLEVLIGSTIASSIVAPFSAVALTVAFFLLRGDGPADGRTGTAGRTT